MAKTLIGLMLGMAIALLLHSIPDLQCSNSKDNLTDLEIYTYNEIYFVQGLTVTVESSDKVITFENMESLKEYIGDVTSQLPYNK